MGLELSLCNRTGFRQNVALSKIVTLEYNLVVEESVLVNRDESANVCILMKCSTVHGSYFRKGHEKASLLWPLVVPVRTR